MPAITNRPPVRSAQTIARLNELSDHLRARREHILAAWRKAAESDPELTTVTSLTHLQFNDHIPQLLNAFEEKLRAQPGGSPAAKADANQSVQEVKHGLQRWQQGYRLEEVMHEWGHLQLCLLAEIEAFAHAQARFDRAAVFAANLEMVTLINNGIIQSAGQYAQLEQAEAAGHLVDLQTAVSNLDKIQHERSKLIHQAVHDLRGNVQTVISATEVLGDSGIEDSERSEFGVLLQNGVGSVSALLTDLMELARLESGQEKRKVAPFDAAVLLTKLCATMKPLATAKGLYLGAEGPTSLPVEGDGGKLRRLLQNLVLNALKYTQQGGVTVSWGHTGQNWWVSVQDTGPGLLPSSDVPIVADMKKATAIGRETVSTSPAKSKTSARKLPPARDVPAPDLNPGAPAVGEGIGLSIVKRLCELLDASLELTSAKTTGTIFRIVLPGRYSAPPFPYTPTTVKVVRRKAKPGQTLTTE